MSALKAMSKFPSCLFYKKGEFETLDKKWDMYKKKHIFTGNACCQALCQAEVDNLIKIWRIKRLKPKQLTFGEVRTYVELSEKINDYRCRVRLEKTRLRMIRYREKMKAAAEQKDLSATNDSSSN